MKAKTNKRAEDPVAAKRSRTLYLTDAEWELITKIAQANNRQRGAQIVHWAESEQAANGVRPSVR